MSIIRPLAYKGFLDFSPDWLNAGIHYEVLMGSTAYGTATDSSDIDVYAFCIPPKSHVFPHTAGIIDGFGTKPQRFDKFNKEGIIVEEAGKLYDVALFNIVRYFELCFGNNPNMLDSLFTPDDCVLEITDIGKMVLEKRQLFLSKKSFFTYKEYAKSQLRRVKNKADRKGKRVQLIEKYGYDVKFASHVIRLLIFAEQILKNENLDLQYGSSLVLDIKQGKYDEQDFLKLADKHMEEVDHAYQNSKLRDRPDEKVLKDLLLNCLEQAYGNLDGCIVRP